MKSNNNIPSGPAPGGASTPKKSSVLSKIREKFKEKPATREEVEQLKLDAQRETYKTQKQLAKSKRPSRFAFLEGGGSPSSRGRRSQETGSFLFGGGGGKSNGGGLLDFGSGPSLGMFGGGEKPRRGKQQKSGLEELF